MSCNNMADKEPKKFFLRMTLGIGITHIVVDVAISIWFIYLLLSSYYPLWVPVIASVTALSGVSTGIIGVLNYKYKYKNKGLVIAMMALSIICMLCAFICSGRLSLLSFVQVFVAIWSLVLSSIAPYECYNSSSFKKRMVVNQVFKYGSAEKTHILKSDSSNCSKKQPVTIVAVDNKCFLTMTFSIGITHITVATLLLCLYISIYYICDHTSIWILFGSLVFLCGTPAGILGLFNYKYQYDKPGLTIAMMAVNIICTLASLYFCWLFMTFSLGSYCTVNIILLQYLSPVQLIAGIWSLVLSSIAPYQHTCGKIQLI